MYDGAKHYPTGGSELTLCMTTKNPHRKNDEGLNNQKN
jgi:hypothetical protein